MCLFGHPSGSRIGSDSQPQLTKSWPIPPKPQTSTLNPSFNHWQLTEASGTGPLQFSRISVNSTAGIVIFCVFYGFLSGAYVTLLGAMLADIAAHVSKGRTWIGMNFGISSVGLLIGNSIAGALIKHRNLIPLQIFGGVMVFANCFIFCYVRYTKLRKGVAWNAKA